MFKYLNLRNCFEVLAILSISVSFTGCSVQDQSDDSLLGEVVNQKVDDSITVENETKNIDGFKEIRTSIPYEGVIEQESGALIFKMDDVVGQPLSSYLTMLNLWGQDFSSLDEVDHERMLVSLLNITKSYDSTKESILNPIEESVSEQVGFKEQEFWLKEHIEETSKILFGLEYTVNHKSVSNFEYFEEEGVYTPPHMGGYGTTLALVLDYKEFENHYVVDVALVNTGRGGYYDMDADYDIPEKELSDYVYTKSKIREVVVDKLEGGGFLIRSCMMKDNATKMKEESLVNEDGMKME